MQVSLAENLEERVGSGGQKDRLKRAQGPGNSLSNETTSRGFYISLQILKCLPLNKMFAKAQTKTTVSAVFILCTFWAPGILQFQCEPYEVDIVIIFCSPVRNSE